MPNTYIKVRKKCRLPNCNTFFDCKKGKLYCDKHESPYNKYHNIYNKTKRIKDKIMANELESKHQAEHNKKCDICGTIYYSHSCPNLECALSEHRIS